MRFRTWPVAALALGALLVLVVGPLLYLVRRRVPPRERVHLYSDELHPFYGLTDNEGGYPVDVPEDQLLRFRHRKEVMNLRRVGERDRVHTVPQVRGHDLPHRRERPGRVHSSAGRPHLRPGVIVVDDAHDGVGPAARLGDLVGGTLTGISYTVDGNLVYQLTDFSIDVETFLAYVEAEEQGAAGHRGPATAPGCRCGKWSGGGTARSSTSAPRAGSSAPTA